MSSFHNEETPHVTQITLRVTNFNTSTQFYEDVIGLQVMHQDDSTVVLGSTGVPRVQLIQAKSPKANTEGLYHVAFLLSDAMSLSKWLTYNLNRGTSFIGASNHEVSEALYLEDPDGNGIEVYADTPTSDWIVKDDIIQMSTLPLNVQRLLQLTSKPWDNMTERIRIGHVHLQAKDLNKASSFYQTLGMTQTFDLGSAKFLSFGGYHHHLAFNRWGMQRSTEHRQDNVDVDTIQLYFPQSLDSLATLLSKQDIQYVRQESFIILHDPTNITLKLHNTKENI